MTITTKFQPGDRVWPIVCTSSGLWLSAGYLPVSEIILRSGVVILYHFEGRFTVDETCVFPSKERADGECLRRNAGSSKP